MSQKLLFNPQLLAGITQPYHIVTKAYVDAALNNAIAATPWKDEVVAASTGNVDVATALNAGDTIDGVVLADGDRVLLKDQTLAAENGIYIAGASPARAADMSASADFNNAIVPVQNGGTANGGTTWRCTAVDPVVGTDSIAFLEFGAAVPDATASTKGVVELATQAETEARTDTVRAVTPAALAGFALVSGLTKSGSGNPNTGNVTADFAGQVYLSGAGDAQRAYINLTGNQGDWVPVNWADITSNPVQNTDPDATDVFAVKGNKQMWFNKTGASDVWALLDTVNKDLVSLGNSTHTIKVEDFADHFYTCAASVNQTVTVDFDENNNGQPYAASYSGTFLFNTGANNVKLTLTDTAAGSVVWEGGTPPFVSGGSAKANELYLITFHTRRTTAMVATWRPIGHSTGIPSAATGVKTGTVSPIGVVASDFIGQVYIDTNNWESYISVDTDSFGWRPVSYQAKWKGGFADTASFSASVDYLSTVSKRVIASSSPITMTLNLPGQPSYGGVFEFDVFYNSGQSQQLTVALQAGFSPASVQWANGTPPCCQAGVGASEEYWLHFVSRNDEIYGWWMPVGHSRGIVTESTLAGYQKTVYRTVSASGSGTILGSATGIHNKFVQLTAYESGSPNIPVGIDYNVADNGDITWSTDTAFTGYIVVSGATTPVSV